MAAAPVRPLGDRVLVRPDDQAKNPYGIIIPEHITEKPRTGVVLAVGQGLVNVQDGTRTAPDVEPGAHVLFSQFGGIDVELAETKYLILREGDLLGIINDAAVAEAAEEAQRLKTLGPGADPVVPAAAS